MMFEFFGRVLHEFLLYVFAFGVFFWLTSSSKDDKK